MSRFAHRRPSSFILKRKMETTECRMQEITEAPEGAPFILKVWLGFLNNHSKSVYSV